MERQMKYIKYFWYVINHKWNVGVECFKNGLYIHALTHDLSKFRPSEFIPYAKYFYGGKLNKKGFDKAVQLHYQRNKHHWNYWTYWQQDGDPMYCPPIKQFPLDIPEKYVNQMICDWKGMSRKFGDTWQGYYLENNNKMILSEDTIRRIENLI